MTDYEKRDLIDEYNEVLEENKRLREALELYADKENWGSHDTEDPSAYKIIYDGGDKARQVLGDK